MSVTLTRVRHKKRRTTSEIGHTPEPVSTAAIGASSPKPGQLKYDRFSVVFRDAKTDDYYYLNVDRENAERIVKHFNRYLNETE